MSRPFNRANYWSHFFATLTNGWSLEHQLHKLTTAINWPFRTSGWQTAERTIHHHCCCLFACLDNTLPLNGEDSPVILIKTQLYMYMQETSFFSLPKHRTKLHWKLKSIQTSSESKLKKGFCPGGNKGITIVLSLFRSHWLAVGYCLVFWIGSQGQNWKRTYIMLEQLVPTTWYINGCKILFSL